MTFEELEIGQSFVWSVRGAKYTWTKQGPLTCTLDGAEHPVTVVIEPDAKVEIAL